jgi:hypothetical protein
MDKIQNLAICRLGAPFLGTSFIIIISHRRHGQHIPTHLTRRQAPAHHGDFENMSPSLPETPCCKMPVKPEGLTARSPKGMKMLPTIYTSPVHRPAVAVEELLACLLQAQVGP